MSRDILAVIGAEPVYIELLRQIPGADALDIRPVLTQDQCQPASETIDFDRLYERAKATIDAWEGPPAGITTYYDFPTTALVALLRRDYGLPGAAPEAVAALEHKYWMRQVQKGIAPDETPQTAALNPFDPEGAARAAPPFPFWLKPIKGHSSVLGFMIEDKDDLEEALRACRKKIHLFGSPFNQFLAHLVVPEDIAPYDGNFAIAESLVSAKRQFTMEGYVHDGECVVYGTIDSLRAGKHGSSFSRYQYPADLPEALLERCRAFTAELLEKVGYDGSPFNAEFFWDPETDEARLLEINTRISKSHAPLFAMVDGCSHHKVAVDLALGRKPDMPRREGKDDVAAKFMIRSYEPDGMVVRMPNKAEIEELRRLLPDIMVELIAKENMKLSALSYQDSYSYELADIFLGGGDVEIIEDAYHRCVDSLSILIKPLPEAA